MKSAGEIQVWLVARIADLLGVAPASIDVSEAFDNYGVSSLEIVALSGDLEEWLGRRLPPSLAYDHPTIMKLSRHLAEDKSGQPEPNQQPANQDFTNEPIAVIGIGCRFPGADDPEAFWKLLQAGKDCISEVPPDRWNKEAFFNPDPSVPGKSISYWGGFLDQVDVFDPFFFGISPAEAKKMDPQQRLLLELSFEALDDAGLVKDELAGSNTGVFVGISVNEYSQYVLGDPREITGHSGTGSALSISANRISYFYDFRGPSIALDTACSSSLSAVHLACQSLRNGECDMALAGGVNIILSPAHSIAFTKAGVLAPDGRCKTFDARANGYVRGEGGGLIVLKRLSAARADGDPIHALILGSSMKQDGRTNGLMAPSQEAQEAMLREACRKAMVAPEDIQYVEAHGTGTLLGDSIEAEALGAVMGQNRRQSPCLLGSVKSNIGHLESAAGIAGLIKVILSIRYGSLPPSVHFETPNPHIPFDALNLEVNVKSRPWPVATGPLLAGVSSFGFGGTIVHTIIRDALDVPIASAISPDAEPKADRLQLLPLSANSPEGLDELVTTFTTLLLASSNSVSVSAICYTASSRRSKYNFRIVAKGNSREELYTALESFMRREPAPNLFLGEETSNHRPQLVFVFPGQGGQWKGMGRELIRREPVFRQVIEQIDQLGQLYASWSLMDVLLNQDSSDLLDGIEVVQPTLFAIQVALTALWKSWGITPDSVVGHSMGEVAAAYVAGGLNLEDAIKVIYRRSQLMEQLRGQGGMLVTELSQAQANELLGEHSKNVSIAAINSPGSTVLSGIPEELDIIAEELDRRNLFCKRVNVDVASHSNQMDSVRDELLEVLADLDPQTTKLPIYSTVSGGKDGGIRFDAEYWMDNLREPVLFSKAINELFEDGHTYFVEIGPHPILLGSIQQLSQHWKLTSRLLPSLHREKPAREVLFSTLASLYCGGFDIDWHELYPGKGEYVHLPSPYWQHQRYWMGLAGSLPGYSWQNKQLSAPSIHPLLGETMEMADANETFLWQTKISTATHSYLTGHQIEGKIVFPAAGYIEMALQLARETNLNPSHTLTDLTFREKMVLRVNSPTTVQVQLSPGENQVYRFAVYSRSSKGAEWMKHATGQLVPKEKVDITGAFGPSPEALRQHHQSQITAKAFYQGLSTTGVEYGPSFQVVQRLWTQDNLALGLISSQEPWSSESPSFQFHPTTMDACLQVLAATHQDTSGGYRYLPIGCSCIRFFSKPSQQLWSWVYRYPESASEKDQIRADIRVFNTDNTLVSEFIGFRFQRVGQSSIRRLQPAGIWLYHLDWKLQDLPQVATTTREGKRTWLIFADHTELGEALVKKLEDQGDTCEVFRIDDILETRPEELSRLISKFVGKLTSPIYGIVHLWGLSIPPAPNADFDKMAIYGSNSILHLVQALAGRLAGSPSLWLVTRGAQAVMEEDSISVAQSAILGLGKVISFEFPELKCIRVDLDPNGLLKDSLPLLFKQINTEDREDQIAYRAGKRFVMRLLPFSTGASKQNLDIGPDRTYLITGGMGALGLETAKWLVRKGARHLVLLGRNGPTPLAEKTIDQIREEGCDVYIALADVSNRNQLEKVFQHIEKEMPILSGIVHSAGVLDDGSLLNLDHTRMKKVSKPKIEGAWHLHELSLSYSLDFFLLYSSAVSVLGSPGQGNYSAASAYLDALAQYRHRLNLSGMSINWGPWADIGLAAETSERLREQNVVQQHLIKEISIEQGLETLELLMNEVNPQVVVLPFDLKNLIELYPTAAGMPFLAEVGGSNTHVARLYARPKLPQQYIAPRNDIERKLAELWRNTLHIDRVGIHDSFFELGGDSVLASQILSLAQKNFGIRVNPQEAFKAFTIERLAEILEAEIVRKIEAMSEEEVQERLSQKD